jgi:DNA primase
MRDQILALMGRYLPGPFKVSGNNIVCKCPFHKGGQETSPSFGVNFVKGGIFNCFACHESGDLRRLLRLLGVQRATIDAELAVIGPELERQREIHKSNLSNFFSGKDPFKADYVLPEAILGVFEWMPLSLVQKGFDPNLLKDMEIGFDRNNNRITYPLRDIYGNLAGISGGATQEGQYPKYKVYQGGHRRGSLWVDGDFGKWFDEQHPGYRCENHDFLWNFHRVFPRIVEMSDQDDTVYIVEGFKACLWMIQAGFKNTVAAMGSYLSERQQRLIHRLGGNVVLCFDNDEAGRRATQQVGNLLWRPMYGRVKVLRYPAHHNKTQPDDYPLEQLREMVLSSTQFVTQGPLRRQQYIS